MGATPEALTELVGSRARELGFARSGITGIEPPQRYDEYLEWLGRGDHGSMQYMAEDFHRRARRDMRELLPEAQSAIVVALSYEKTGATRSESSEPLGRIASYALGDDYHGVIKRKLAVLSDALREFAGQDTLSRACVDSAPLLERELAERAGLGFVAKNTMLITPGLGSYTLLGVLLTSAKLAPTRAPSTRDCGSCTACLEACPTDAFRGPYQLDSRRCISYLTIENKGPIPEALRPGIGERIFGCDACQDVCPYNATAPSRAHVVPELRPRSDDRASPSLAMLAGLGSNQHKRYVDRSALRRNRREQLLRNISVALGNQAPHHPALETLASHESALVREHAAWAQQRGTSPERDD